MSAYGPPSRKEQERMARVRAMAQERTRAAGVPNGPDPQSGLAGRRGVVDSVPQDQLTPDQFRERNMPRNNLEMPRLPGQGRIWDQQHDNGEGGYFDRAPNQAALEDARGKLPDFPQLDREVQLHGPAKHVPYGVAQSAPGAAPQQGGTVTRPNTPDLMAYLEKLKPAQNLESAEFLTGGTPVDLDAQARALGIDPEAYSPQARGQLQADVQALMDRHEKRLKNYDVVGVAGGGQRYTPNAAMKAKMEERKSLQTLETLWNRWHEQAGKTMITGEDGQRRPMTYADFAEAYNAGEGLSHVERAANLQRMLAPLKAQKRAEVSDSLKARVEQDNMARRMNTHVANIVFADSLRNAQTPEDMIRTMVSGHVQNPSLGLGNMAMMTQRGMDDLKAQEMMGRQAREQAEANLPGAKSDRDLNAILQNNTGPALLSKLEQHAIRNQPQGVPMDESAVSRSIVSNANQHARSIAEKDPRQWTAEDMAFMQQLSRHYATAAGKGKTVDDDQVFANWANAVGLKPNEYGTRKLWKHITGGEGDISTWGDWGNAEAWSDWWNSRFGGGR